MSVGQGCAAESFIILRLLVLKGCGLHGTALRGRVGWERHLHRAPTICTEHQPLAQSTNHLRRAPTSCTEHQPPAQSTNLLHKAPTTCTEHQPLAQSTNHLHRAPTTCTEHQPLAQSTNLLHRAPTTCTEHQPLLHRAPTTCTEHQPLAQSTNHLHKAPTTFAQSTNHLHRAPLPTVVLLVMCLHHSCLHLSLPCACCGYADCCMPACVANSHQPVGSLLHQHKFEFASAMEGWFIPQHVMAPA